MPKPIRSRAKEDQLIEKIYRANCSGMQIEIMRIPKLFAMAREMLRRHKSHEEIGEAMRAYVRGEPIAIEAVEQMKGEG